MPWQDPQFWIVSVVAALALRTLVRAFKPSPSEGPACGSCAAGAAACAKPKTEAESSAPLVVLPRRRSGS